MLSRHSFLARVLLATTLMACGGESPQPTVPEDPATAVARVSISAERLSLAVGSSLSLSAAAANAGGTVLVGKTISWASSRPNVASVTSEGVVTGVVAGTAAITATSGGRSATVTVGVQPPNRIVLTSDASDYIGGGKTYIYTNANAVIQPTVSATMIRLRLFGFENWDGEFTLPIGSQLQPGSYVTANGSGAGLLWDGEGRGCNTTTGTFTIDSLSWTAGLGSSLASLDLHFEQHCDGVTAALRGTVHWRADDPTMPPGLITPIPTTLWQPPSSALPSTGDYAYLASQPGDPVGKGVTTLWQTGIGVSGSGTRVTVSLSSPTSYAFATFQGIGALPAIAVGYYPNLTINPFRNPVIGGLEWNGDGRGCSDITGWFAVDRVNYVNGALVGIALRFEQHCQGVAAPLNGAVRWGQLPG